MLDKSFSRKMMVVISSVTAITLITGYLVLLFLLMPSSSPSIYSIPRANQLEAEAAIPDDGVMSAAFFLEIDGEVIAQLREVSGISAETQVIESKQGSDKNTIVKLAGITKYSNLVLERSITDDTKFSEWFATSAGGNPDKKNTSIVLSDFEGAIIARYNFENAWPCKYELSTFGADAAANDEPITETLEICHERMTRVSP